MVKNETIPLTFSLVGFYVFKLMIVWEEDTFIYNYWISINRHWRRQRCIRAQSIILSWAFWKSNWPYKAVKFLREDLHLLHSWSILIAEVFVVAAVVVFLSFILFYLQNWLVVLSRWYVFLGASFRCLAGSWILPGVREIFLKFKSAVFVNLLCFCDDIC